MDAVDSYIPTPERQRDKPFLMPVEDVFGIKGRGTVATGRIERGLIQVGDPVEIVGIESRGRRSPAWKCSRRRSIRASRVTTWAFLLRGIERADIERGQVLAKPGSIKPHTQFQAQVYVLSKEEGRTAHAVLQRLSTAVLCAHDRRDGSAICRKGWRW